MRRLPTVLLLTALLAGTSVAVGDEPALNRDGDVIVALDGGITPRTLPRKTPVPVAVRIAGDIRTASSDPALLPQVRRISVAINRQGRIFDRGLPTCRVRAIQPATEAVAKRACGAAIVGSGRVVVQVRIPGQLPFSIAARILAFNGPRRNGHKLILAQAYARRPPGSFVLVFRVGSRPGELGTVLSTTLPPAARQWAYLKHFDLTLRRVYRYGGRQRSFVSAACRAPDGFTSALFPFAKATYEFGDGRKIDAELTRLCRVAKVATADVRGNP